MCHVGYNLCRGRIDPDNDGTHVAQQDRGSEVRLSSAPGPKEIVGTATESQQRLSLGAQQPRELVEFLLIQIRHHPAIHPRDH